VSSPVGRVIASRLTGLRIIGGEDKARGKTFGPLVKGLPAARALPVRPDLPSESCTMDGAAMARFQADYLAAFLAARKL